MDLRGYPFKAEYRSGSGDLVKDLYHPALQRSETYWRAVGYFSSSALETVGSPLGDFVYRGGTMRLVTSVELREGDRKAIEEGLGRSGVCEERLLELIKTEFENPIGKGTALLLKLLESGRLELRIAVPLSAFGIYHEKVGIFIDDAGDFLSFSGSSNESRTALEGNYECIDVYSSWKDGERAKLKKEHFEQLWEDNAPGVTTLPFPEAAKRELIKVYERDKRAAAPTPNKLAGTLWDHQREAVETFLRERRGILEMATGTGKTFTALHIARQLASFGKITSVIITAHGTDLLDQWAKQLFGTAAGLAPSYRVLRHYDVHHQRDEFELESKHSFLVISRGALHSLLRNLSPEQKGRLLIIHDEVHGLGSKVNVESLDGLSDDIPFRLGLSATPEREYDETGNDFIEKNVGPVIYRFPLEDAIRKGILCGFDYFPIEYTPSEEDKRRLNAVHRLKAARAAQGDPMKDTEFYTALARVYKISREKIPLFIDFLHSRPEVLDRSIIFVAEKEYGEEVLDIIHNYRYDYHTYFAEDDRDNLIEFAAGTISCLVTCHRVSEGIDIRSINSVVLFSSDRAKLETIQRIGRCLRVDPANPSKRALVVDFVRVREEGSDDSNADQSRREWLTTLSQVRREIHESGT